MTQVLNVTLICDPLKGNLFSGADHSLGSARRHGIPDDDMLHAFRNAVRVFDVDEDLTMLVGPARDGTLLEVGVVTAVNIDGLLLIHAMPVRDKYLR